MRSGMECLKRGAGIVKGLLLLIVGIKRGNGRCCTDSGSEYPKTIKRNNKDSRTITNKNET